MVARFHRNCFRRCQLMTLYQMTVLAGHAIFQLGAVEPATCLDLSTWNRKIGWMWGLCVIILFPLKLC